MKFFLYVILILLLVFSVSCERLPGPGCLIGAFIADSPTSYDINRFKSDYGKKPYLVMVFVDWENFVGDNIINDVYGNGSILFITWEPWYAVDKKGIYYDGLLSGMYDDYIKSFANKVNSIGRPVFLRFAHEMNGNWYPWSGSKLGRKKYIAITKYVRAIFDKSGVNNVKWVFSINWENIPDGNNYKLYYPGNECVDYIGIDGYNWGSTRSWSKWASFKSLFSTVYTNANLLYNKPILISEFGSTGKGGDKKEWIRKAMNGIKNMRQIKGFIIFNVDKEADWRFQPGESCGEELKKQLEDPYFMDKPRGRL
ncbi:MAG: dockerin [Candidatus Omnitrophota bacterium]|nr:MAG: dockerin [Candidatus Omnitrophota bacterium]